MECYVGLDVSLKQTSVCVVNQTGSIVQEGMVDSDPEAIASFVRSKAPGIVRIGLETGPTATWQWTELKRFGLPVICIDARHAKAVLKMQINKSDRNDAAGIARIMQTGWFREVRVKDLDSHAVKAYWRARRCWSRLRIRSCSPCGMKYSVGFCGTLRSGPTFAAPAPFSLWQVRHCTTNRACPARTGSVDGSAESTASAGQRAAGEGWLTRFAIWYGHCSLRMLPTMAGPSNNGPALTSLRGIGGQGRSAGRLPARRQPSSRPR